MRPNTKDSRLWHLHVNYGTCSTLEKGSDIRRRLLLVRSKGEEEKFQRVSMRMASCLTLLVLILASMGANASDDQLPLEAVVQQLAAKVTQLESRQTSDETRLHALENKVAFRTDFSLWNVSPPSGIFRFDHVALNDGNGYDPTLGVFTAPVGGVYIFAFQFYTQTGSNMPQMDIKLNGNILSRMTGVVSQNTESNMMSVAAKLSVGDKVWVEGSSNVQEGDFWGPFHTFFYGVLVYNI